MEKSIGEIYICQTKVQDHSLQKRLYTRTLFTHDGSVKP